MADLLNAGEPYLCRYNSGSPRHTPVKGVGRPSPRGRDTFVPITKWSLPVRRVVEITFVNSLDLPRSTQWGDSLAGPWQLLSPLDDLC